MNNHIPVIIQLKGAVKSLSGKVGKKQRAAYPDKAEVYSKQTTRQLMNLEDNAAYTNSTAMPELPADTLLHHK